MWRVESPRYALDEKQNKYISVDHQRLVQEKIKSQYEIENMESYFFFICAANCEKIMKHFITAYRKERVFTFFSLWPRYSMSRESSMANLQTGIFLMWYIKQTNEPLSKFSPYTLVHGTTLLRSLHWLQAKKCNFITSNGHCTEGSEVDQK